MPLDVDGRHVSGISGVTFRITADSRTDRILAPITGGGRRATRSRACGRSSSEWLSYDLWVDDPTSLAAGIRHSARGSRGARKGGRHFVGVRVREQSRPSSSSVARR